MLSFKYLNPILINQMDTDWCQLTHVSMAIVLPNRITFESGPNVWRNSFI